MKAVLVFCEGAHDVAFVTRSLGQVAGATWIDEPIGRLPSPFGPVPDPRDPNRPIVASFIARRYAGRALDGLQLRYAGQPPPPAFDAMVQVGDTLYVLVRCGGDTAAPAAIDLLTDLASQVNPAFGTDVTDLAAAFLFDADASVTDREASFAASYASLLAGGPAPRHGGWVQGEFRCGLYVFADAATQRGTLEELLAPLVAQEWSARWQAADQYLAAHARPTDPVSVKPAERLKAQITVTGQFRTPGDPMTTILSDRRLGLPAGHFGGPASQALVTFLQGVPW